MSYFATITFDIKTGTSEDYKTAYEELRKIGFSTTLTGSSGKVITLPTTTCAGEFTGSSAADLRDSLCDEVQRAFRAKGFAAEIFITIGDDWAWVHKRTGT